MKPEDEHIIAGDEVVDSKTGKKTYGLDRFFSGIQQLVIPGLSFFTFSLVNIREEHSYPMQITQTVKSVEEKGYIPMYNRLQDLSPNPNIHPILHRPRLVWIQ